MECTHGTWGIRLKTFAWDGGLVTLLFLEPNRRCSWHYHKAVYNQFTCVSGKVGIKTDKEHTTWLTERQSFTTEPGEYHEFQTGEEGAVVEEIAYAKYCPNDIHREKLGGPLNG